LDQSGAALLLVAEGDLFVLVLLGLDFTELALACVALDFADMLLSG
jgi:hypothetical protein